MLEKLEDYREKKMQQEIELLEMERMKEQQELQKARDKERKYAKYLEKQKEQIASHSVVKMAEEEKKRKQEEKERKRIVDAEMKKKKDQELKKKQIAEYKAKKQMTEELLANADLAFQDQDDSDNSQPNSEDEASRFLDQMIAEYNQKGKRPPAVLWRF